MNKPLVLVMGLLMAALCWGEDKAGIVTGRDTALNGLRALADLLKMEDLAEVTLADLSSQQFQFGSKTFDGTTAPTSDRECSFHVMPAADALVAFAIFVRVSPTARPHVQGVHFGSYAKQTVVTAGGTRPTLGMEAGSDQAVFLTWETNDAKEIDSYGLRLNVDSGKKYIRAILSHSSRAIEMDVDPILGKLNDFANATVGAPTTYTCGWIFK